MAEERVSSVIAQSAFDELDKLRKGLHDAEGDIINFAKASGTIELKLGDTKSLIELNVLIKELQGNTQKISDLTKAQADATSKLALAQERLAKSELADQKAKTEKLRTQEREIKNADRLEAAKDKFDKSEEKRRAQEQKRALAKQKEEAADLKFQKDLEAQADKNTAKLLKNAEAEQKKIDALSNDYGILSKAYEETALKSKNYELILGKLHPLTVQLQADAKAMNDKLQSLDATHGRYTRNVGNYNAVAAQFNQLLREAPNAGISLQTFMMSLSNNFTYFVEAIQKARAEGQSWKAILGTMASSAFGLIGIINILAAVFLAFGDQLFKQGAIMEDIKKKQDAVNESLDKYNQGIEKQAQLSKTTREITAGGVDVLKHEIALLKARGAAAETVFTKEQELRRRQLRDLKVYYESIRYGDQDKATQALRDMADKEYEMEAARIQFHREQSDKLIDLRKEASKKIADADATEALVHLEEIKNISKAIFDDESNNIQERLDAYTRMQNATITIEQIGFRRRLDEIDAEQKAELEKYRNNEAAKALIIKTYAAQRKVAYAEYDIAISDINAKTQSETANAIKKNGQVELQYRLDSLNKINEQVDIGYRRELSGLTQLLKDKKISIETFDKRRAEIESRYAISRLQAQAEYLKGELEDFKGTSEEKAKMQVKINEVLDNLANQELANFRTKEQLKQAAVKRTLEVVEASIAVIEQVSTAVTNANKLRSQQDIDRIQTLIDANDRAYQYEVDRINVSKLSAEDKEKAIRDAQAKTESQRQALEARQRRDRQSMAEADKANTMSQIILNTALAVIKAFTEGDPYTKGFRAALAAGVGATQLAIAASTPIPQYAVGTLDHPGGEATVAELEPELIKEPGKPAYMIDSPTTKDFPKHTQVFNSEMMYAMLSPAMIGLLTSQNKVSNDNRLGDRLDASIHQSAMYIGGMIKKNRAIQSVNINGTDSYYQSKVKGKR